MFVRSAGLSHVTDDCEFLRRATRRFGHTVPSQAAQDTAPEVSIFTFGDRRLPDIATDGLRLPDKAHGTILLNRYFEFAAPTMRYLHEPTVKAWFQSARLEKTPGGESMPQIRRAILFLVMAIATCYLTEDEERDETEQSWLVAERYYQAAQSIISKEAGAIRLESIQARLATVSYLLNTSRLNQAWFTFGTCFQLILALGLHRRSPDDGSLHDHITQECRKRCFWTAYTYDGYFSVMLGRPPFFHDADLDQRLPKLANDQDILADGIRSQAFGKDCVIAAPLHHAKLAKIVKRASREQYVLQRPGEEQQIETAEHLNEEIEEWRKNLPVFLSGAIHPSTLVPVFRRQLTVLRIACAHAVILINRPLMLSRQAPISRMEPHIRACLDAARQVLGLVLEFVAENRFFSAFWNTQVSGHVSLRVSSGPDSLTHSTLPSTHCQSPMCSSSSVK